MSEPVSILFVDDDPSATQKYVQQLRGDEFRVLRAQTVRAAKQLLGTESESIDLVILDVVVAPGEGEEQSDARSGLGLAKWIRESYPLVRLLALSDNESDGALRWFKSNGVVCLGKARTDHGELSREILNALSGDSRTKYLSSLIVHRGDETRTLDLKDYLHHVLGMPEPSLLATFEADTIDVDIVLVLLSDDNAVMEPRVTKMLDGYPGRVLFLHDGKMELAPSRPGVVAVDISGGMDALGEEILKTASPD